MNRTATIAALAVTAVALTGCDKLTGDHPTPVPVASEADPDKSHLTPGLWRAVPPLSAGGCYYMVFRDGYPVQRSEVYDSVPVYAWLSESTADTQWGLTTVGCGTWQRVTR